MVLSEEASSMEVKRDTIWQERADYIDALLFYKCLKFEKNQANIDIGAKKAIINSIRRRVYNPKVYYNPIIQLLFRIKIKLGIKFS